MRIRNWILSLSVILILLLVGCSPGTRGQPSGEVVPDFEHESGYPPELQIVYNAYIELLVRDTDAAAGRAAEIAFEHGGYLSSSQSWFQEGRKYTTLVLVVPSPHFDAVRREVVDLGSLATEKFSGERWEDGYGQEGRVPFSQITLHLRPRPAAIRLPSIGSVGWNPLDTFEKAFGVFVTVFGFVVDIAIWLGVVIGPFALIAWGVWRLVKRWQVGEGEERVLEMGETEE